MEPGIRDINIDIVNIEFDDLLLLATKSRQSCIWLVVAEEEVQFFTDGIG